jgi:cyclophilin family peptidyl-prolyl cis-trans isomerase
MRLKIIAMLAAMLCAGSVSAQRPLNLPTSGKQVPPPASAPVASVPAGVPALEAENTLHLDLSTGGRVTIQLRPDVAPRHVERIKALARKGFYNGVVFHRVIEGFMAQTGDPTGTGQGGSELPDLKAEFNALPHVRGTVSAARTSAPDTANSQFFIAFTPRFTLDGEYTAFGRVVSGMQYVDAIERGEPPATPSRIVKASIGADNVPPPSPAEVAAAMQRPLAPLAAAAVALPAAETAQTAPAAAPPAVETSPATPVAPVAGSEKVAPPATAETAQAEAPATPQ